ncbi:MAG: MoaD/ThiS family protein [Pseudomonadota bacterium]
MIEIRVEYFAVLREQRGASDETVQTEASSVADLYAELAERHSLSTPRDTLRVAINEAFSDWQSPLADGDVVVFIPPVAGG